MKLYALAYNEESVKAAMGERFSRISGDYVLLYTDADAPGNGVEIGEADAYRLNAREREWLRECNIVILAEAVKANAEKIAEEMRERVERLEGALREEKKKLEEESRVGESDGTTERGFRRVVPADL